MLDLHLSCPWIRLSGVTDSPLFFKQKHIDYLLLIKNNNFLLEKGTYGLDVKLQIIKQYI